MLAGSHLLFGNALALSASSTPLSAFLTGLISHHIGDALPHIDGNIFRENEHDDTFLNVKRWPIKLWILFLLDVMLAVVVLKFTVLSAPEKIGTSWRLLFFWASIGSVLPDVINFTNLRELLRKTLLGKAYLNFHKNFHFKISSKSRKGKIFFAFLAQSIVLLLSIITLLGIVAS